MEEMFKKFFRQTLPSVITGGWTHEPEHPRWIRITHATTFVALFLLPLILVLTAGSQNTASATAYAAVIFVIFLSAKIANYWMQNSYDQNGKAESKRQSTLISPQAKNATSSPAEVIPESPIADPEQAITSPAAASSAAAADGENTPKISRTIPVAPDESDTSSVYSFVSSSTAGAKSTGHISRQYSSHHLQVETPNAKSEKPDEAREGNIETQSRREVVDLDEDIQIDMGTSTPVRGGFDFDGVELAPITNARPDLSLAPPNIEVPTNDTTQDSSNVSSIINNLRLKFANAKERIHELVPENRVVLEQLLDRDQSVVSMVFSCLLASASAWIGHYALGSFDGFNFVLVCFVLAGSQFSLLKGPQPDSNSPLIDNPWNGTSRPFYFIVILTTLIILQEYADGEFKDNYFQFYDFTLNKVESINHLKYTLKLLVMLFPVIFLFGFLPQAPTFFSFLLEQFHIIVFGGSGTSSLASALLSCSKDVLSVSIIWSIGKNVIPDFYDSRDSSQLAGLIAITLFISHLCSCLTSDIRYYSKLLSHQRYIIFDDEIRLTGTKIHFGMSVLHSGILSIVWYIIVYFNGWPSTSKSSTDTLQYFAVAYGLFSHFLIPSLRRTLPFSLFASPFLLPMDSDRDVVTSPTKLSWFEVIPSVAKFFEGNVLYPLLFSQALEKDIPKIYDSWSHGFAPLLISVALFKLHRSCFMNSNRHYITLIMVLLISNYDYQSFTEMFLIDFYILTVLVEKVEELILKLDFGIAFISPWNLPFGSVSHLLLYPLAIPHMSLYGFVVFVTSIFSVPMVPFIGSCIMLPGYARPIRFWEKKYMTRMNLNSNQSSFDFKPHQEVGADSPQINGLFYKQFFLELEESLATEIMKGRLGEVNHGDMLLLTNDNMTVILHIIEVGNGFCTFQMRGMEFKGTLCQQRELESVREPHPSTCLKDEGILSVVPEFIGLSDLHKTRAYTWTKINEGFVLKTYSISQNPAQSSLQLFTQRKLLLSFYIKALIYYASRSSSLYSWLNNPDIKRLYYTINVVYGPGTQTAFSVDWDEDYSITDRGVTYSNFKVAYNTWIAKCMEHRYDMEERTLLPRYLPMQEREVTSEMAQRFFYLLSVAGRRVMQSNRSLRTFEHFIAAFYTLFRGSISVSHVQDEWLFLDLSIMQTVITPAARMSLQLHQDSYVMDDNPDPSTLYDLIISNEADIIICPESHELWEQSIQQQRPQLLSLRRVTEPGQSTSAYYTVRLFLTYGKFQITRLNRECVRGLWASEQYELLFLQNQQSERGSIQQMKATLRNLVNQSCDLPIGYPIFVSEIGMSYTKTTHGIIDLLKALFKQTRPITANPV